MSEWMKAHKTPIFFSVFVALSSFGAWLYIINLVELWLLLVFGVVSMAVAFTWL